jgi:hypothetical protein
MECDHEDQLAKAVWLSKPHRRRDYVGGQDRSDRNNDADPITFVYGTISNTVP